MLQFDNVSIVADLLGIAGAVFALLAWAKARAVQSQQQADRRRQETPISIVLLNEDGRELHLPYRPMRGQLSRGEIAGIIGMFAGGRRFSVPGLNLVFANGEYDEVVKGKDDTLSIPTPEAEWRLFADEVAKFEATREPIPVAEIDEVTTVTEADLVPEPAPAAPAAPETTPAPEGTQRPFELEPVAPPAQQPEEVLSDEEVILLERLDAAMTAAKSAQGRDGLIVVRDSVVAALAAIHKHPGLAAKVGRLSQASGEESSVATASAIVGALHDRIVQSRKDAAVAKNGHTNNGTPAPKPDPLAAEAKKDRLEAHRKSPAGAKHRRRAGNK